MSLWQGKKYVKVFQPMADWRQNLSDLLVFSYDAYQNAFDTSPGVMQVVRGVGLSKATVHKARERLKTIGLYSDSVVQPPPDGLLYPANRRDKTHWRDRYAYWHYYVRSPDSSLTTLQLALLSFLWHLRQTRPDFRLSISFLALLLCAKRDSISNALQVLESQGLLTYQTSKKKWGGLTVSLRRLTPTELRHFQDVATESNHDQITVIEDVPHSDPTILLKGELERIGGDEEWADAFSRRITTKPGWPRDKTAILQFCQKCPSGSQGIYDLNEAMKMGLAG